MTISCPILESFNFYPLSNSKPSAIGQTEWPAWQSEQYESSQPTMILDGQRIGILDSTQTDLCLNNWPFPREEGHYWSDKIQPYSESLENYHI